MCWCTPSKRQPLCNSAACVPPNLALKAARDELAGAGLAGAAPDRPMPGFQRPPAIPLPVLEASGLTEAAARALLADVRANHRLLAACLGHLFAPLDVPGSRITARYRCEVCTGTVDAHAKHWYDLGRAHGAAHGARPLPSLTNDERLDGLES